MAGINAFVFTFPLLLHNIDSTEGFICKKECLALGLVLEDRGNENVA